MSLFQTNGGCLFSTFALLNTFFSFLNLFLFQFVDDNSLFFLSAAGSEVTNRTLYGGQRPTDSG